MSASVPNRPLRLHWFGGLEPQTENLWLVDGLLPAQGTALLYAEPQCAKSFLALDLSFHVAEGRPWFGRPVRQGGVVYVAAEGGAGLRNRVEAIRLHFGVRDASIGFVFEPIDLFDPDADTGRLVAAIHQAVEHFGCAPAAVIIDTLSKTFGRGKENTDDMRVYVSNADRIANACGTCVILVHHRPKNSEVQKPRGHSSLEAGVDTAILVTRLPSGVAKQGGARFLAAIVKQKDGPCGDRLAFALETIVIGENGETGEDISSCVIVPAATPDRDLAANAGAAIASGAALTILNQLRAELNVAEQATGRRYVSRKAVRARVIDRLMSERAISHEATRKAYERAEKRLLSQGSLHIDGDRLTDSGDTIET